MSRKSMQYIHAESKRSLIPLAEASAARVKIEYGSRCIYHGLPEYIQLSKMLGSYFQKNVAILPRPQLAFLNHFRVYVGETLIFDSYTRYPPTMEVVKCVEDSLQEVVPAEIPHRRGIPFSYWNCPEHEGALNDSQVFGAGGRTIRLPSSASTASSSSSPKEEGDTAEPPPQSRRPSLRRLSRLQQPLSLTVTSNEVAAAEASKML